MYAKINDKGQLYFISPRRGRITTPTAVIFNPTEEQLEANGYKPCISTQEPATRDGYYHTFEWVEKDNEFTQVYTEHKIPDTDIQ